MHENKAHSWTIQDAIQQYLDHLSGKTLSDNTKATYRRSLALFCYILSQNGIDPERTPIYTLPEDSTLWVLQAPMAGRKEMHQKSPPQAAYSTNTKRLLASTLRSFYKFLSIHEIPFNNAKINEYTSLGKQKKHLPRFDRTEIEKVIEYVLTLKDVPYEQDYQHLINLRDRALIVILADTGLRIHEALHLRRGDIDWLEYKTVILGKGEKQAAIRFSPRAIECLRDYLSRRADRGSARELDQLPLFLSHDRPAKARQKQQNQRALVSGKPAGSVKPLSAVGARKALQRRVGEALGEQRMSVISPHTFRHYFVTTVLRSSGNLKLAQILARHADISTTSLYAHLDDREADEAYWGIFGKMQAKKEK